MAKPRRNSIIREIRTIRRCLASIDTALARLAPSLNKAVSMTGARPPGRTLKLSAARRAVLKLQGQYMGYVRRLKPSQKQRVKALKAARGFPAAIRFAKRLAKG